KPGGHPSMSSNTTQGPFSARKTASAASPISSCPLAPRTIRTSPSLSASESHSRKSTQAKPAVPFKPISTLLRFDIGEPYHFRPFVDFAGNELAGYIDARPHIPQLGEIFLQRTAGPYIWVIRVETDQDRLWAYVRSAPKS